MTEQQIQSWRKENNVIYFTITSDGTTGSQWVERLESKAFQVSKWAKDVLTSSVFNPTTGITTEIAVLPGKLFNDSSRITHKIRTEAERRNFEKPNAEVACLIREEFSDEEIKAMGFWWFAIFHEPIKDSGGDPDLLAVNRCGGGRWLSTYCGNPDDGWGSGHGFAFAVSQ